MTRYRDHRALPALLICLFLIGCGTIIHGGTQEVSVSTTPSGADVTIDGANVGETPITQSLDRGSQHTIELELDGYESQSIICNKTTSGWVWGNIVFGGLVGLAVDASTGGMYKLEPGEVARTLDKKTAKVKDEDTVHIAVVMEPKPDWKKIGQLEPSI